MSKLPEKLAQILKTRPFPVTSSTADSPIYHLQDDTWGLDLLDALHSANYATHDAGWAGRDELVLGQPRLSAGVIWQAPQITEALETIMTARAVELHAASRRTLAAEGMDAGAIAWAHFERAAAALIESSHLATAQAAPPRALPEALILSIATAINAAHLDDRWSIHHELLATGAWLGLLQSGRAALMPAAVAGVLLDHRDHLASAHQNPDWPCGEILGLHAATITVARRLLLTAEAVLDDGVPRAVTPFRPLRIPPAGRTALMMRTWAPNPLN